NRGFEYGWVRGTGSAAFIGGLLFSGQAIGSSGLSIIVALQAVLLATAALCALLVPEFAHARASEQARKPAGGVGLLLRIPAFRNVVPAAALIRGSHAMNDAFAVIRWSAGGIGPGTASMLWSLAVAAEVLVFFVIGPPLLALITPAGAI